MNPVIDPVWPWSHLWALLSAGGPRVVASAAVAAGMAFLLPVMMQVGSVRGRRRGLLLAVVVGLTLWGMRPLWGAWRHSGLAERASPGGSGLAGALLGVLLALGLLALLVVPPALAGVGVGTCLTVHGPRRARRWALAGLRLFAFVLAGVAILRPALGFPDRTRPEGQLLLLIDDSRSMTIRDEAGGRSRWELVQRTLKEPKTVYALQRLLNDRVEVRFYKFADELGDFDPTQPGEAEGPRTDVGGALARLLDELDRRSRVRGLVVISDGADNGTRTPALAEVARWRNLPCPVHALACGNPATTLKQNDIAVTSITTEPSPFVPVKGRLKVKVSVDARGFENSKATAKLYLEGEEADKSGARADKLMTSKDVVLSLTTGNEVQLECNAPTRPGEYKVKVVVDRGGERDAFPQNNEIETFVTVSKEGISVLLVDRLRDSEPKGIVTALEKDPRIRVNRVYLVGGKPADVEAPELFRFDEQPYDVIILGDVTAAQVRAIDPKAPEKIEELVARGSGFMMLGGYSNFGNGGWKGTPLEAVLPVDLSPNEQDDSPVRMTPTEEGLRKARYLFRVGDGKDLKGTWERLPKLEGFTVLRLPKPRRGIESVLATADGQANYPLLVTQNYSRPDRTGKVPKGAPYARVLAFGGDTTERWTRRTEEGRRAHERFWRQVVVWLAKQEDAEGSVWVKPDARRLPPRGELGFAVGIRGKGGGPDLKDGTYRVEVVGPDGAATPVAVARAGGETRGTFARTNKPGVYKVVVHGSGKDAGGQVVEGSASARVIVYPEDVEMMRTAADHEFLKKLAGAGGGEFRRVEELADLLNKLRDRPAEREKVRLDLWPDWRRTTRSGFFVGFYALFVLAVSAEWLLRRRWGLV
jgi:uncharacterized membrane protein